MNLLLSLVKTAKSSFASLLAVILMHVEIFSLERQACNLCQTFDSYVSNGYCTFHVIEIRSL